GIGRDVRGVEVVEPVAAAEEEVAVARAEAGAQRELEALQPVREVVDLEGPALGVEATEAAVGTEPEASRLRLHDAAHDVAGQAVLFGEGGERAVRRVEQVEAS